MKIVYRTEDEFKKDGAYLFNTHEVTRLLRDTSKYTFKGNSPKKFPHLKWAVSKAHNPGTITIYNNDEKVRIDVAKQLIRADDNDGWE